jgi:hypothetical protein
MQIPTPRRIEARDRISLPNDLNKLLTLREELPDNIIKRIVHCTTDKAIFFPFLLPQLLKSSI